MHVLLDRPDLAAVCSKGSSKQYQAIPASSLSGALQCRLKEALRCAAQRAQRGAQPELCRPPARCRLAASNEWSYKLALRA